MPYVPTGLALDPNDNVVAAFGYGSDPRGNALENLIQTFRPRPEAVPTATPSLLAWLNDNKTIVYTAAAVLVVLAVMKAKR
jgi:hypothetical protein